MAEGVIYNGLPMPLYEYECSACGHRFERIQKFSDPPEKICPKCGGEVHKLMSSPAVQFKGSGWYVTDYARKDSKGKESGDTSKDTKEKDTKSESTAKDTKTESTTKDTKGTKSDA